jgi:hypothetical protein
LKQFYARNGPEEILQVMEIAGSLRGYQALESELRTTVNGGES